MKLFSKQLIVNEKSQNLRRLQAQRNELNAKGTARLLSSSLPKALGLVLPAGLVAPGSVASHCGKWCPPSWVRAWVPMAGADISISAVRLLREELQLLQEQGSYVGEVVRAMDKKKVLVKV